MPETYRTCIVGAGGIAPAHLRALQDLPGVQVQAIVDPNLPNAMALAARFGVSQTHANPTPIFSAGSCDVAHILVPPQHHKNVALEYIEAGLHVLIEKPLALSTAEADEIRRAALARSVHVGVNHNLVFSPAFMEMKHVIDSGRFGRLQHLCSYWNKEVPLVAAGKYGHWMFREPGNIFFEQAVHPLSQIHDLVGPMRDFSLLTTEPRRVAPGVEFIDGWQLSLNCERSTAQLFCSASNTYPTCGLIAICEVGAVTVDSLQNRMTCHSGTVAKDFVSARLGMSVGTQTLRESLRNAFHEAKSLVGLEIVNEPEDRAMCESIAEFYKGLDRGHVYAGVDSGREIVRICERVTEGLPQAEPLERPLNVAADGGVSGEVAIFGGTGFIGAAIVEKLLSEGLTVRVMARNLTGLPAVFYDPGVQILVGDVVNEQDVDRMLDGARFAADLAFSFGNNTWDHMESAVIGGARNIAKACLKHGVERLVYASSIASLYLGKAGVIVTDDIPCDPKYKERNNYSKAKALCERMLLEMHSAEGLPVCILRPGIVVGSGGNLYHPGVAEFRGKRLAICNHEGRHPLPFVTISDTADAFFLAMDSGRSEGQVYNVVGDIRLSAREYVEEVSRILGRPLTFHGKRPLSRKAAAIARWMMKALAGRRGRFPSLHSINSQTLYSQFDTSRIKRELNWTPINDRHAFIASAVDVHRPLDRGN